MIKERVAEILLGVALHFQSGDDEKMYGGVKQILNLFKAEVDKLTVIDDGVVSKHWHGWAYDEPRKYITIHDCLMAIVNDELQHTKKQLLDLIEESHQGENNPHILSKDCWCKPRIVKVRHS